MSAWIVLVAMAAGWLVAAPIATRAAGQICRCHGEDPDGFRWGFSGGSCRRHCPAGCWRPMDVSWISASIGAVLGLAWPLLAPVALTYWLAGSGDRRRPPSADLDGEIARLEKEWLR